MSKILFVSTNDQVSWGGSEVLWSEVAKVLVTRGHAVMASVWEWAPEPEGVVRLRSSGVQLHKRAVRAMPMGKWRKALTVLRDGALQEKVNNELEAFAVFRPDLVVFSLGDHLCPKFLRYAEHVRKMGVPYAVIVQLVNEYRYLDDSTAERFALVYEGARAVFFVSAQNRSIVERQLAIALPNASLIDNPVDTTIAPVPFPDTRDGFHLAMVASLVPVHKGQDIAFEVLSQPKWKERPLRLDLYGTGEGSRTLERLRSLWSLDNVTMNGYVADKRVIWQRNHGALFASRMEGRSLALLEAMAHGRMVISTDVGGARDLITEGREGFVVPTATAEALDAVMERAWDVRQQWGGMGERALASVRAVVQGEPAVVLAVHLEGLV